MTDFVNKIRQNPLLRQQVINIMSDGVFALDVQGRIVFWSRSMEQLTGYTQEEAMDRSCTLLRFSDCFGQKNMGRTFNCRVLEGKSQGAMECFIRHKDGRRIPVIKKAAAAEDEAGQVMGIIETLTDLTELERARLKIEEATRRLGETHRLSNIIGKSPAMQGVFTAIRAASLSDATTLVQGESGTGKELVAGAIHYNSDRRQGPLVVVNCSALSESLLESELFGHARGAFTGATQDRIGRLEEADCGTIFLDEIGELSPMIQVKLLRVLQEHEIERVGESRRRKLDIRVVTATHRDLSLLVAQGRFREDLYYRLKVFPVFIPPLKQRRQDLPLLIRHFIDLQNRKTGKAIKGVSLSAMQRLMDHDWPGNVRELENAVEHAFVLCSDDTIGTTHLPREIREMDTSFGGTVGVTEPMIDGTLEPLTQEALILRLRGCGWNKAEVARQLGLSRTTVWKRMKEWKIPLQPGNTTIN